MKIPLIKQNKILKKKPKLKKKIKKETYKNKGWTNLKIKKISKFSFFEKNIFFFFLTYRDIFVLLKKL